jgi:hypothetical protein
MLLNVESGKNFLALSFLGFFCLLVSRVLKLLLLFFSTLVLQLQQEQQQP